MSNVQFGSTAQPMSDTSRRPITNTLACTLREEVDGQWAVVWRAAGVGYPPGFLPPLNSLTKN